MCHASTHAAAISIVGKDNIHARDKVMATATMVSIHLMALTTFTITSHNSASKFPLSIVAGVCLSGLAVFSFFRRCVGKCGEIYYRNKWIA